MCFYARRATLCPVGAFSANSFSSQTVETKNQNFGWTSIKSEWMVNSWVFSSQINKVAISAKFSSILFARKMRASVRSVARVDAWIAWFSVWQRKHFANLRWWLSCGTPEAIIGVCLSQPRLNGLGQDGIGKSLPKEPKWGIDWFENGLKICNFVRPGPETAVLQSCWKHSFSLNRYGMLRQLQVFIWSFIGDMHHAESQWEQKRLRNRLVPIQSSFFHLHSDIDRSEASGWHPSMQPNVQHLRGGFCWSKNPWSPSKLDASNVGDLVSHQGCQTFVLLVTWELGAQRQIDLWQLG